MLTLTNISKIYETGGHKQMALDHISIAFRKNEFVSILGQSGSGKTTLLNIIGGLDHYTSGDLTIDGKSTKDFKDSDWDAYRNHSIGFVFQSYHLIPHQSILANVELAMTLSGVDKKTRRQKALTALEQVGLKDHVHKKPSQLSGGQMQRVAIARALVNNPEILLADEPTGALDSETSVQIMTLLKEIAQERLVIMVTHNPELAEEYSTRIVNLRDGHILSDTAPYQAPSQESSCLVHGKTKMSFFTALSLSFANLRSKLGRTLLTAFAGSIGIIGIALILSLSSGVQDYIDDVQEDTLTSYPLSITEQASNLSALMGAGDTSQDQATGVVTANQRLSQMIASGSQTNDLASFKTYVDQAAADLAPLTNAVQYQYDLTPLIYRTDVEGDPIQVNPSPFASFFQPANPMQQQASSWVASSGWSEMMNNLPLLKTQYEVLAGTFPESYDQVVIIVDENEQISDFVLYGLGLKTQEDLDALQSDSKDQESLTDLESFAYQDLLNLKFKVLTQSQSFEKQDKVWIDQSDNSKYMKKTISQSQDLKVVGILKPKAGIQSQSTIGYTRDLIDHLIQTIDQSAIVKDQLANEKINIFTNKQFPAEDAGQTFDPANLSNEEKAALAAMSPQEITDYMNRMQENANATYEGNLTRIGYIDADSPSAVLFYPKSFDAKNGLKDWIAAYNQKVKDQGQEAKVIEYTDQIGLLMNSVTSIIEMISYVLIAFVAISLVVSSIMIGIITYISVLERTKEIGILRAIGASKRDIARVFNAETIIEGVTAGLIGIGLTLLLNWPINLIVEKLTGVANITKLPWQAALILIAISTLLTALAGLLPASLAAKKDPVEALRTE